MHERLQDHILRLRRLLHLGSPRILLYVWHVHMYMMYITIFTHMLDPKNRAIRGFQEHC